MTTRVGACPRYAGVGTLFSGTSAGAQNVNIPSSNSGDLLLLVAEARASNSNGAIGSLTAGWTQLGGAGTVYGGAQIVRIAAGYLVSAGTNGTTNISVTFGGTGTVRFLARVHRFSALDGFDPTPVANVSTASTGTGTTLTFANVSPSGTNQLAVQVYGMSVSAAITPASGESGGSWIEPYPPGTGSPTEQNQASNGTLGIQTSGQAGGGAITGGTASITSSNWASIGFTLVPTASVTAVEGALPAYSSAGTLFSGTSTGAQSVNIPASSSGDLLLLVALARASNSDGAVGSLSGSWTQVGGNNTVYGGAQISRLAVGWLVSPGTDGTTNVSVTFGGTGTVRFLARVYKFTATNGFNATAVANLSFVNNTTGTSIFPASVFPSGVNQLAVQIYANSVSTTVAASTGESGGDWTEPVAESTDTNGMIGIQVSDQSSGASVQDGSFAITSGNWATLGVTLVPGGISAGVTPTFVAAGAANATTASSIAPAYPASLQAGDLFILHCVGQGQTTNLPTVDVPSGWTALYSSEGANNQCKQWIFKRDAQATGSESGTLTVTCTTPGTNGVVAGAIYAFRNVTPVATVTEDPDIATGTSTSIAPPAVTAGNARLCCAFVGVGGNQTPASFTGETGGDWTVRNTASGATGDGYCLQLQTANVSNATITGGTAAITSDDWVVRVFALKSYNALVANSLATSAPVLGAPTAKPALIGSPLIDRAPVLGQPTVGQIHALNHIYAFDDGMLFDDGTGWSDGVVSDLANRAPLLGQPAVDSLGSLAAASLTTQAPMLAQPTLGQKYTLAATALVDRAPLVGQPGIGQKHALTATNLADRAPLVGQPVVGQKHVLTATALPDRQPLLAQPVMVVKRNLTASSLVDRQSLVGQPTISQKHVLAATALADRQPVLGQPVMGVKRNLVASSLADRQPIVAQPVLGVTRNLAASDLADRQPLLGQPTAGQKHILAATTLTDRQPSLDRPIFAVSPTITALPLINQQPLLGAPAVGQKHALAVAVLIDRPPLIEQPGVGQKHALTATGLAGRQPLLAQPVMAVTRNLAASSLDNRAPLLGVPAVGQKHALAAAALVAAPPTLAHPILGQAGVIVATDLASAPPVLASPIIHQTHALSASTLTDAAPRLDQSTATQGHHLAATGLVGVTALFDHASLTIGIFGLAANDLSAQPGLFDQADIGQEHALAAADQNVADPLLGTPVSASFLPGTFIANDLDAQPVTLGSPKVNWRDINVIRFGITNKQAKVDAYGARPAYASAGAGVSSSAQLGALAPLAPVGVQPGDLLLWVAAAIDVDCNVAAPAGYTQLLGSPFGASTSSYAPRLHIALKTADGAEAGASQSFSYSLTSGDASRRSISARVFRITAINGFAASGIEGIAVSEGVTSSNAAIACPPVVPAGVNRLGLIVTVVASVAGDTSSAGGIWQQAVPEYQSTIGGDVTLDLQWAALARDPSTGAQIPYGAVGDAWVSVGFALAPPRTSIDFASAGVIIEDRTLALAKAVNA